MDAEKPKFLEGADKNGIENKTAEGIWDLLASLQIMDLTNPCGGIRSPQLPDGLSEDAPYR